jgi:hypothetical protein
MNWHIQTYLSDTNYFVSRRGVNDWTVLDPLGTLYGGFTDENAAMAFAESLSYANLAPTSSPSVNLTFSPGNEGLEIKKLP